MGVPGSERFDWAVRVVSNDLGECFAFARNHKIVFGEQASLKPSDAAPSAIEGLLGALGADLARGLRAEAARNGVPIFALELSISGELDNVLVHLGVVGETGHAGLGMIRGRVYVSTQAERAQIEALWTSALRRSPTYQTLSRAAPVELELSVTP